MYQDPAREIMLPRCSSIRIVLSVLHLAITARNSPIPNISEFERVGSFHLKVRLGTVDYDKDKRWLVKVLYEGDVH